MKIGERIAVRHCLEIKAAVVAAGPPRAIRLGDKMERRSPWARGAANNAGCLEFGEVSLSLVETVLIKAASLSKNGGRTGGGDVMLNPVSRVRGGNFRGENCRITI